MKARTLYVAAGVVWGLALGLLSAAVAAGLGAAVFWTMLYGDDPWPGWAGPAIGAFAVAVGAAVLVGSVAVGMRLGRRADAATDPASQRRRAGVLLGLGVLAVAAVVLLGQPDDMPEISKPGAEPAGQH